MNLEDALQKPCVADTSFLSNLVFTGNSSLMRKMLNAPVYITPVVLDPFEPLGTNFLIAEPLSEILRPLFFARQIRSKNNEGNEKYAEAEIPIQSFVHEKDTIWQPVVLTTEEQELALEFRSPDIWKRCTQSTRRKRLGLDPGEAEALAVSSSTAMDTPGGRSSCCRFSGLSFAQFEGSSHLRLSGSCCKSRLH